MLDTLRDIRRITSTPQRGCTRLAYTHFEDQAHDYVWDKLRALDGLAREEDAAGNTFIVPTGSLHTDEPIVLIGSHLDTVIEGGWLDGALGVVAGMYALQGRADGGAADPRVGLVVFRDEEGVRFNTGLFGSGVFAGGCTPGALEIVSTDGVRLHDVVRDPEGCCTYRPPVRAAAFLECHIEQGERLSTHDCRVGVVSGIVGIRRFELVGQGMANHAGTTDMRRRLDALVPVADVVARSPGLVEDLEDAVITCGRMQVEPGAPNIVPGRASAIVEIRGRDDATLDAIEQRLRSLIADLGPAVSGGRCAEVSMESIVSVAPTPTDATLNDLLAEILEERNIAFRRMASMAGHDTQQAARRCGASMFFIPSIDGVSHNPAEDSHEEDIQLAGDLMLAWVERCVAACL
jgi:N-carbamoyl-L-amino-acid hydrolase